VALLQGNISQDLKFQAGRYAATLATYRRLIESSDAKLVVLPETAIPRFLDSVDPGTSMTSREPRPCAARMFSSACQSAIRRALLQQRDQPRASPSQRYDKAHLVPFGEFVPWGFHWIVKTVAIPMSDFSLGKENPQPLSLAGQRVAPNICWEDAFGEEIIRQLPEATLLVNVSNVAWFGDSLGAQPAPADLTHARDRDGADHAAPRPTPDDLDHRSTGQSGRSAAAVYRRHPRWRRTRLHRATPYVKWGNAPIVLMSLR